MTAWYATLSVGLVVCWLAVFPLRLFLRPAAALGSSILLAGVILATARNSLQVGVLVSLLGPVSLGLSFLILRSLSRPFIKVKPVPVWEQVVLLILLIGYFMASAGWGKADPYSFGYDPVWVGFLAAGLCITGSLRGYLWLALLPVAAQVTWVSGLASSNYLDHVFSAIYVPVLLSTLTISLVRRTGWANFGHFRKSN